MFSWTFSSRKEHGLMWYVVGLILVLVLVVYGIVEKLYLMSIVSLLFAGVYILIENNSAPITRVDIDDQAIRVGGSVYEFSALTHFSLISVGDVPTYLRLTPRKKLSTIIDIPLTSDVNPTELRNYLSEHIEHDKDAILSNSDAIIHAMRL
jgi:hypothetical protein